MLEIPERLKKEEFRFVIIPQRYAKSPPEKEWSTVANYHFNDSILLQHLTKNKNYGVLTGVKTSEGYLIILDADCGEVVDLAEKNLPQTFTVETATGGRQYYFYADFNTKIELRARNEIKLRIFNQKHSQNTAGEVQGLGQYVVGSGSVTKSGVYKTLVDKPIAKVTKEKIVSIFHEFINNSNTTGEIITNEGESNLKLEEIYNEISNCPAYFNILKNPNADWQTRNYLVLLLKNKYGLNENEIFNFLKQHNSWSDFNETKTRMGIRPYFKKGTKSESITNFVTREKLRASGYCLDNCKPCLYLLKLKEHDFSPKFNFEVKEPTQQIGTLDQLKEIILKNFPTIWFETKTCLATCATLSLKNLNGCPSLNLIGNPSGEKTTVLSFFYGQELTYISDDFTPRAFVSHSASVKENDLKNVDLLPKIQNKILITPELAPLFEAPKDKLLDNFAILTRVLDGEGLNRDSGTHGHRGYSGDYKFIWLGASTPFKGAVWRIMGKIGNRLFFINMKDKNRTDNDFLEMFKGVAYEEKVKECRGAVRNFLDNFFKKNGIRKLDWDAEKDVLLLPEIIKYAKFLTKLRGSLMLWQGEEDGKYEFSFPIIEEPPRAINLLYNIAKGHALINGRKSLENDDIEIIKEICFSSMPHDRYKFLQLLAKHDGMLTTHKVESELNCSKDTALRTMKTLQILDIVSLEEIQVESSGAGRPLSYIKINPEFLELLPHTQGRKDAINNKSHEIYPVCVRCNAETDNPTTIGLCELCATAIKIINLIRANSNKNDSNAGVSFDILQQLSGWQMVDLEFVLKRLHARGDIYEVNRGFWKVLE